MAATSWCVATVLRRAAACLRCVPSAVCWPAVCVPSAVCCPGRCNRCRTSSGHPAWFFFAGCGFKVLVVVLVFVWACRLQDGWFGWAETREAQLAEKSLVLLGKASASAASVASASAAAAASASAASVVCDYNTSAACLTVCGSVHAGAPEAELGARLGACLRACKRAGQQPCVASLCV